MFVTIVPIGNCPKMAIALPGLDVGLAEEITVVAEAIRCGGQGCKPVRRPSYLDHAMNAVRLGSYSIRATNSDNVQLVAFEIDDTERRFAPPPVRTHCCSVR